MLELCRRAYLQALGVMQYTPTSALPSAKPSPILSVNQIYPEIEDQQIVPVASVILPTEADAKATLLVVDDKDTGVTKPQPLNKAQDQVKFSLAMVEVPGALLVLMDLSDVDAMGCSGVEYQLLKAILKSVGVDAEPSTYLFKWPMVNNPAMSQGEKEAAEGLKGFLAAKQERRFVPSMLLIGHFASCFALKGQHTTKQFSGSADVGCYSIPALSDMLSSWQAKAEAWQVLSLLRNKLVQ